MPAAVAADVPNSVANASCSRAATSTRSRPGAEVRRRLGMLDVLAVDDDRVTWQIQRLERGCDLRAGWTSRSRTEVSLQERAVRA